MLHDFSRLTLWNVLNVGFVHLLQPRKYILLGLSVIAIITLRDSVNIGPNNIELFAYFPFISLCVFLTAIINKGSILNLTVILIAGEFMGLAASMCHYYNLRIFTPHIQNRLARLRGCPGH